MDASALDSEVIPATAQAPNHLPCEAELKNLKSQLFELDSSGTCAGHGAPVHTSMMMTA
jgi:hypothetical protein